jgi:hypothetical protein
MEPELFQRFRVQFPDTPMTEWKDQTTGSMHKLPKETFICEYRGKTVEDSTYYKKGDLSFRVFKIERIFSDDIAVLYDTLSNFAISEVYFDFDKNSGYFSPYGSDPKIDLTNFPHICILCKQPAYLGGLNNCECSNNKCSLYCKKES